MRPLRCPSLSLKTALQRVSNVNPSKAIRMKRPQFQSHWHVHAGARPSKGPPWASAHSSRLITVDKTGKRMKLIRGATKGRRLTSAHHRGIAGPSSPPRVNPLSSALVRTPPLVDARPAASLPSREAKRRAQAHLGNVRSPHGCLTQRPSPVRSVCRILTGQVRLFNVSASTKLCERAARPHGRLGLEALRASGTSRVWPARPRSVPPAPK